MPDDEFLNEFPVEDPPRRPRLLDVGHAEDDVGDDVMDAPLDEHQEPESEPAEAPPRRRTKMVKKKIKRKKVRKPADNVISSTAVYVPSDPEESVEIPDEVAEDDAELPEWDQFLLQLPNNVRDVVWEEGITSLDDFRRLSYADLVDGKFTEQQATQIRLALNTFDIELAPIRTTSQADVAKRRHKRLTQNRMTI